MVPNSAITYQSIPDFDSWGSDTYWTFDNWKDWYYKMARKFNPAYARARFRYYYKDPRVSGYGGQAYNWIFDPDKKDFLNNTIDIETSDDLLASTTRGIKNIGSTLGGIAKILPYIVLIIVIVYLYGKFKRK